MLLLQITSTMLLLFVLLPIDAFDNNIIRFNNPDRCNSRRNSGDDGRFVKNHVDSRAIMNICNNNNQKTMVDLLLLVRDERSPTTTKLDGIAKFTLHDFHIYKSNHFL